MSSIMKSRPRRKKIKLKAPPSDRHDAIHDVHGMRYCLDRLLDLLEEKKRGKLDASEAEVLNDIVCDISSRAHVLSHKLRTSCAD